MAACADLRLNLNAKQCHDVQQLRQPAQLPESFGNRFADDPNAASLGYLMFFDARLTPASSAIRCASCHAPEEHFCDGRALAQGVGTTARNAPILLNAAWNRWQQWDGRADSAWSQPVLPLEADNEMGSSRLFLAHAVTTTYSTLYQRAFGAPPDFSDITRFPAAGKPGEAAFDSMAPADKEAINTFTANIGKAFEAYLRRMAAGPAPLDQFLAGDNTALSAAQRHGLEVFVKAGCISCHGGANLTDDAFHNLGVPAWPGAALDTGRNGGLAIVSTSIFNSQGPYYDSSYGKVSDAALDGSAQLGAIKTPSLRNVVYSAPYGHNGVFSTLEEAVDFHLGGGGHDNQGYLGPLDPLLVPQQLSSADRLDLLAFLNSLVGSYRNDPNEPPNWWDWPDR